MRTRQDPRRETTRVALIEAAEALFARFGVDVVSTRQLGAAIGSQNTNVVSYHFGSKDALVEAVYRYRLPQIDRRRGELLREAEDSGQSGNLDRILHAFALPLFEQTDADGQHSYARFVAAIERSGMIATRGEVAGDFPETAKLIRRIVEHLEVSVAEAHTRIRLAMALIVASLHMADVETEKRGSDASELFEIALAMATAGLKATVATETTY